MVTYMCRGMFLGGGVTQVPYQEAEPKMVGGAALLYRHTNSEASPRLLAHCVTPMEQVYHGRVVYMVSTVNA